MASKKCCKPFDLEKKCPSNTHVDKDDNMLYVSEGRPCTEPRYINTNDLVSDPRGTMSYLQEKLKKHSKKKYKIQKGSVKVRSLIDQKIEVLKKNLEGSRKIVEELTSTLETLEEENRDLKLLLNKAQEDNV